MSDETKPGAGPDSAFAVHQVSTLMGDYISRLGTVWIEGQIAEVRETRALTYLKLRDTERDATLSIYLATEAFNQVTPPVEQGSRLIVQAKADWWPKKGSLQFKVLQMRAVGIGELMARIAALRDLLAAEGLFAPERKRPLPFLPRRIGLICGQNSDAMHDVIQNARRRWPDAEFVVREVPVTGATSARAVKDALTELDAIDDVDVIVVTRGGGSFEDLLPFSDETMVRAVAACQTPVVAAIGHEEDKPLIDYVADYRASTPTDAARAIVPDVITELSHLRNVRSSLQKIASHRLAELVADLDRVRSRPALAQPGALIVSRQTEVKTIRERATALVLAGVDLRMAHLTGQRSTLRALSPLGTLERGFAIVRDAGGQVVRSVTQAELAKSIRIRVADGEFDAEVSAS